MAGDFDLQRFVDAQQFAFETALAELRAGRKKGHWVWFIFPQLEGLGHSEMAQRYGISGADEADAYLHHPLLGPRLETCSRALLEWRTRPVRQIMGTPDDLKLRSCMTLFAAVAPKRFLFRDLIDAFFDAEPDPVTLSKLGLDRLKRND